MRYLMTLFALGAALFPTLANAQVEARAGFAIANGTVGGAEVSNGYGVSLNVQFDVLPVIDLYGAFTRYTLGAEVPAGGESLGVVHPQGRDADVVDLAYSVGAKFAPTFGPIMPWVKVGGVYDEVELKLKDEVGSVTYRSEGNFGYEAAGGLSFQFTPLLSVTPGILYRSASPSFREEAGESDLSFWAIELGVAYNY
ncbi:MAG TPA: outer membrane beta-barrel protein [Acidimicrobiia bacterium]|nr:outer membrane beta-barrel protein [Acidimicrobiia bacterium]